MLAGLLAHDWIKWLFDEQASNAAYLIGTLLLTGGGLFALHRWRADRRVRRIETIMQRIRSFDASPGVRNASMLIYNHSRQVPLYDPSEPPERRYDHVVWDDSIRALVPPTIIPEAKDRKSSAIRDSFEDFLGRLGELELFLQLGGLSKADGKMIVGQWVTRFGITNRDHPLTQALRLYVHFRQLNNVKRLFRRYGTDLEETLEADLAAIEAYVIARDWGTPEAWTLPPRLPWPFHWRRLGRRSPVALPAGGPEQQSVP